MFVDVLQGLQIILVSVLNYVISAYSYSINFYDLCCNERLKRFSYQ